MTFIRLIILLCLSTSFCSGQFLKNFDVLQLRPDSFYLVTRGTLSKGALIAEKFNRSDRCSTHIGIAIFENSTLKIYNVTNEDRDSPSALVLQASESFTNLPDIDYFGIWEYRSSAAQISTLKTILQNHIRQKIEFDFDFNESDNDKMYCSEFCAKVLRLLDPTLDFALSEIPLDAFHSMMLGRKTLRYWPVDFFQSDLRFVKIYESYK